MTIKMALQILLVLACVGFFGYILSTGLPRSVDMDVIGRMAQERGIENISIGYIEPYGEECMIYVTWENGDEKCILD